MAEGWLRAHGKAPRESGSQVTPGTGSATDCEPIPATGVRVVHIQGEKFGRTRASTPPLLVGAAEISEPGALRSIGAWSTAH